MLALLRQCRWLAVTLLLAAPGLGGTLLPMVHPCVSEAPWMAGEGHHEAPIGQAAAMAGHDAPAPATDHSHSQHGNDACHCIGACHAAAMAALGFGPAAIRSVPLAARASVVPAYYPDPPTQQHLDRHPPSTAPPVI